ncbi:unnamed protein product [Peronospora belbahrii]|uniref:Sulfite oxidase n=1 Tax=Peronospora belbahrii TaxID=622444 RepID=A0AAU9L094_9STRA|nr:unnamed protein product [Peronospora belbahrii]CAH0519826.1 unnamed protein product [Peronospora belbahrii]
MRHPALKVNSSMPFNAEPPAELLMESFTTPNKLFFVRNHLPVPESKLKQHTVTTTVQCAGDRRAEMSAVKPVNGLSWDTTAISTANWTGVLLSDVLASISSGQRFAKWTHVHFEGLDADIEGNCYGASIPISTALDPRKDVLLAFEMNGETIPRDHRYPLRVIVPGTVGARNVKFLHRIVLSSEESPSFWQQRDYKGFPPNVDYSHDNFWKYADSSILTVKGYAWSGGGRNIIRVDVSTDGGKTSTPAELHESGKRQTYNRAWAWTPWEIDVKIPLGTTKLDIVCKAVDASYNVQPDTIAPIWNMRGILNNAWHRIHVLVAESDEDNGDEDESCA